MNDQDEVVTKNLRAADKAMKLTPEERDLYMRHLVPQQQGLVNSADQ